MIVIGACFKDEFEYLIEWFAWYKLAGFDKFIVADNESTDGTTALLEALSDLGWVTLIYQPTLPKEMQISAYARIAEIAMGEKYRNILFVDADEFLTHESMIDGEEHIELNRLISRPDVRLVGINWRTFGSSGHKLKSNEPVTFRFTQCESDHLNSMNGHLKSASQIAHHWQFRAHVAHSERKDLKVIDCNGNEINDFIFFNNGTPTHIPFGDILPMPVRGPLRVNHYVIKSEQEYIEKKERRGDIQLGVGARGMDYFNRHDFKRDNFKFPDFKMNNLREKMNQLFSLLQTGVYGRKIRGGIDYVNSIGVSGWLIDEEGNSEGLSVNIFVNGIFQGKSFCGFFRSDSRSNSFDFPHDEIEKKYCAFRYTHPRPLNYGDIVEVKVHGNSYTFPALNKVSIV